MLSLRQSTPFTLENLLRHFDERPAPDGRRFIALDREPDQDSRLRGYESLQLVPQSRPARSLHPPFISAGWTIASQPIDLLDAILIHRRFRTRSRQLTTCIYAPVKEWQKRATLGAVFGALSTAPNPPL